MNHLTFFADTDARRSIASRGRTDRCPKRFMPPASTAGTQPAQTDPGADAACVPPIVFFDGVCGFCNHTVDFLLRHDHHGALRYAPLQGETATQLLPASMREELKTLVLWTGGDHRYIRSAAAVRILWRLGGLWKLAAALLWVIPLPLRDLGYRFVARVRYRLFGQRETCRLPTPEEAGRLLP